MKNIFFSLLLISYSFIAQGQQQTFDIATYTIASGWAAEIKDFAASYTKTNTVTRTWCRVTIYKSIASSGNSLTDFNSEWNTLMVKNNWGQATAPQPETETEDGWTSHSVASTFTFENKQAYSLLNTISGYGVEVSIVVLMNNTEYMKDIEQLLLSLDLKKPTQQSVVQQTQPINPVTQPKAQTITTASTAPGKHGISTFVTTFDDGWVAQPFADYVQVTKGSTTVLLHYGIEITDELRNTGDVEGNLFDRLMQPRYTVSNIKKFENELYCYFCIRFYEADVVEKSTGKKYYAGFRILTENGISRCIEILSPSRQDFQREFPTQEKIAALTGYNKFAVSKEDLIGTWEESGGSYINMYNTVTGAYAGMNSSSSAHKFIFKNDGTYFSNHKGAYGMVGSMNFYDQKYNGNFTVTPWDLNLTKRYEGKTDVFWAEYQAVRGGRVLLLTNKTASGIRYSLVKTE
jgi:hypothetical protein